MVTGKFSIQGHVDLRFRSHKIEAVLNWLRLKHKSINGKK